MARPGYPIRSALLFSILLAAAPAGAIDIQGSLEVSGDLRVSGPGEVVFPDGSRQASAAISYRCISVVSPVGTAAENGAALLAAMAASRAAEAEQPWLIRIEPGDFDIGPETLEMIPYVGIEGAGEDLTRIIGCADGGAGKSAVVKGADHSEVRFLSILQTGGGTDAIAVSNQNASPRITRVRVSSSGAVLKNIGIYNDNASPLIRGITVRASGGEEAYGIWNNASAPVISGGSVTACNASKKTFGVYNENSGGTGPNLELLTITGTGAEKNYGVHDNSGRSIMRHLTVIASGGEETVGVEVESTAKTLIHMVDVRAEAGARLNSGIRSTYGLPEISGGTVLASGGNYATGIYVSQKDLVLQGVLVTARDGAVGNTGVRCQYASPTLVGLVVVGQGPTTALNTGLDADSDGDTLTVSRSSFRGNDYAIRLSAAMTLDMGASHIDGPINVDGAWHCAGCWDGNFSALTSDCR